VSAERHVVMEPLGKLEGPAQALAVESRCDLPVDRHGDCDLRVTPQARRLRASGWPLLPPGPRRTGAGRRRRPGTGLSPSSLRFQPARALRVVAIPFQVTGAAGTGRRHGPPARNGLPAGPLRPGRRRRRRRRRRSRLGARRAAAGTLRVAGARTAGHHLQAALKRPPCGWASGRAGGAGGGGCLK
jgi:hypothetical protein